MAAQRPSAGVGAAPAADEHLSVEALPARSRDLGLIGPHMTGRASEVVHPLEPRLLQLLQAVRVDAAAGEGAARGDGVHGMFCRESVPDHLAGHVGSEDELETAGPVRLLGQHPLRLARLVTRLAEWSMPDA